MWIERDIASRREKRRIGRYLAGMELAAVELHGVGAVDEPPAVRLEHVNAHEAPEEVAPRHPERPVACILEVGVGSW